jgi:small subunit ribosomal protein S20
MPHTKSAKKRLRQTAKRREHNRAAKRAIKKQLRKVAEVFASGTMEQVRQEYNLAAKKLDKAAARRIIHPNLAARRKAQLARALNAKAAASDKPASS